MWYFSFISVFLAVATCTTGECDESNTVILDPSDYIFGQAYLSNKLPTISGTIDKMYTSGRFEGDITDDLGRREVDYVTVATPDYEAGETWPPPMLHITEEAKLWPNGRVPYVLSADFSRPERARIAAAFIDFEIRTCVKFVPRESDKDEDYLYIIKGGECWSHVGKLGGRQELSLHGDCLKEHGVVLHELLHSIGFWHEQSRSDRDDFVTVHYENIAESEHYNFEKKTMDEAQHLDEPYDFESVMHYTSKAFSKNGKPTITPIPSGVLLGLNNGFTEGDERKVNFLYQCDNVMPEIFTPPPDIDLWSDTIDACIEGHNDEVVRTVTFEQCKEECLNSRFICQSVEFLPTSNRCNLSSQNAASLRRRSDYAEPCRVPGSVRPMYAEIVPPPPVY